MLLVQVLSIIASTNSSVVSSESSDSSESGGFKISNAWYWAAASVGWSGLGTSDEAAGNASPFLPGWLEARA
jgi:hypothetical protein